MDSAECVKTNYRPRKKARISDEALSKIARKGSFVVVKSAILAAR